MFYRKQLKQINPRRVRVAVADFSGGINAAYDDNVLPVKYASLGYNFECASGGLKHCNGIDFFKTGAYQTPFPIMRLYFYKRFDKDKNKNDDRIIAYCADKKLYSTVVLDGNLKKISGAEFNLPPNGINHRLNGEDVIIFTSEEDTMVVWDGENEPYAVPQAPKISSCCVHYERLFVTVDGEKSAVWFSDDLDPTNWDVSLDNAGFIEIADEKGALLKAIRFLDYVYIFRSYGITRLTAYAEQTEFSVVTLYTSSGRIFPHTVSVCGNRIIFLAEDGLYSFDGLSTKKILETVFPLFKGTDNKNAVSAFYNGKYYLACSLNYNEIFHEPQNNTLMEYNINNGTVNLIKGADITSLAVINSEIMSGLILSVSGHNSDYVATVCEKNALFSAPLTKVWKLPSTDLGYPEKEKLFRELYINTEEDITVFLKTEKASKRLRLSGGEKRKTANVKGKRLEITFMSQTTTARISQPVITADIFR